MRLVGTEVPVLGSDSVIWIELSVPTAPTGRDAFAPLPEDYASCSALADPPSYLIWRIHKASPHALELLHISPQQEFPRTGLRILFSDALSPFAFVCPNESNLGSRSPYLLYAMTVSGVAFMFQLRHISSYTSSSSSIFPASDFVELDVRTFLSRGRITSIAATSGCLLVGTDDGSLVSLKLGSLLPTVPGFLHELRDDSGIGRLLGFMSRVKPAGGVQDLVMQDMHGKKLVFALHADGLLRVWDLFLNSRILSHTLNIPSLPGGMLKKMWVGDANNEMNVIPLAILYRNSMEDTMETIDVFGIHFGIGERSILSVKTLIQNIHIEEGGCIDTQLSSDDIWILKENGLVYRSLFHANTDEEEELGYTLQEEFVADQLFQSPERFSDDLLWITCSLLPLVKDNAVPLLSSIFLDRLLHPGVFNDSVLRATMMDYNRCLTDSELESLTIDGVKKEILLLVEYEGVNEAMQTTFYRWKNFCNRYFHYWCKNNAPLGLLPQLPDGGVGLVRKSSISFFRSLEEIELLVTGSDEINDIVRFSFSSSDNGVESEVLAEIFGCMNSIGQQFGKAASAVLYEVLVTMPSITSDEIFSSLLKTLQTGYSAKGVSANVSDVAWEKDPIDHKSLRRFSTDILLTLRQLSNKASSWGKVLEVVEGYLKLFVPHKVVQKMDDQVSLNICTSIVVQATSQIAKMMFESASDILLFLSYLVHLSGQINMSQDDVSRIRLELVPMIQEIIAEWLIIHFFAATPSESYAVEDFSSQLSSLKIDSNSDRRSWDEKLGRSDFVLAFILLLSSHSFSEGLDMSLLDPQVVTSTVRRFTSWIIWGLNGDDSSAFLSHSTELALILIRHGQYKAAELLLSMVEAHSRKEYSSASLQNASSDWCVVHHLLGCCLLHQAHALHGFMKERKISDAVRCFFRASSGKDAARALQKLSPETGLPPLRFPDCASPAAWKLHYYQWVMQIFEQHNISEGASQFSFAALEQVDEALNQRIDGYDGDTLNESATAISGRLWANVFKFTLDLNNFYDAYCAIISNPDEESKHICLRRFINVLFEHGALKILSNGQLPSIGLMEKVEQELFWKAERSDILMKQNPYKFLYSFEMHRHNWRKAASYLYRYTARLRTETSLRDNQQSFLSLQERLNGLSAAINALHLVRPAHAWIEPPPEDISLQHEPYPSKKPRKAVESQAAAKSIQPQYYSYLDIEKLEREFVMTSAEYLLSLSNVKWSYSGSPAAPSELVDILVQTNLYDMAFTVLLKFWKNSGLKRELERVFSAMSLKCCPNAVGSPVTGKDFKRQGLLLTSTINEAAVPGLSDMGSRNPQYTGNSHWEILELYLGRYKDFHARLPVVVAETLLRTDSQIELPLWLVRMFKGNRKDTSWGMAGHELNPASLFQLFVDYGRYTEATHLLLEYIESFASVRPAHLIHRKRPSAVWFPYTTVERLWCHLEQLTRSDEMAGRWQKLQKLLHAALLSHLKQLKVDSEDALSSAVN
ncbi:nuclear pore complex protein NUP160 isoform X1 [Rhodamnia argentea]|uniref:Nuclear pore complex protein NUP160 isoform X1 n=1 Tax=Rhodamnia argentea TaxID=178133 RepID=A0A8B8R2K4_9MYRT|nr:nuclear pore complex protein NUP160 isoform X1 [Rhodamnia argentea]